MRFYYVPNCVLPCPYPYYFNPPAFAIFNLFISADHFLGNLQLLYYACERGVSMRLVSEDSIIFAARNKIELGGYVGRAISVFPFSAPLHILESRGFKYSYPQQIGYGECRGVSNIVLSAEASISLRGEDTALVIINLGRV